MVNIAVTPEVLTVPFTFIKYDFIVHVVVKALHTEL